MGYIKLILLILAIPVILGLAVLFIGVIGSSLFEDWDVLGPILAIAIISAILGAVINAMVNKEILKNKKLCLHSDPLFETDEEKQFKKNSEIRFALIYGGLIILLTFLYLFYKSVFY